MNTARLAGITVLVVITLSCQTTSEVPPAAGREDLGEGRIVFASDRDRNYEIYTANPDGTDLRRITNSESMDVNPCWSPDGQRFAFASDGAIWIMDTDGGNKAKLTQSRNLNVEPAWSPDGSRIAFVSLRDGDPEIFVMDIDGTDVTNLTDNDSHDSWPAWSPDGQRIAFESNRDGDSEIYVMSADGTDVGRLTRSPGKEMGPAWSPDGNQIAFRSARDGDHEIYLMAADGSDQTRLTRSPGLDTEPTWSPDGNRIVFTSERDGRQQLYSMKADGTDLVRLTDSRGTSLVAKWSPAPGASQGLGLAYRPPTPLLNVQSAGGALVSMSLDYSLFDRWYKTPTSSPARGVSPTQVVRGQVIYLPVVLMQRESQPDAHMEHDVAIVGPDGAKVLVGESLPVISGEIASGRWYLSDAVANWSFDDSDQPGTHVFQVTVRDLLANESHTVDIPIDLVDRIPEHGFTSSGEFFDWMTFYYQTMQPERAIPAFEYYVRSVMLDAQHTLPAVLGFFVEIFSHNRHLVDEILERYAYYDEWTQRSVVYFFHYMGPPASRQLEFLVRGDAAAFLDSMRDDPADFAAQPVNDAAKLDYLWGEFFAGGRYQTARDLVSGLRTDANSPALEAALEAAKWSIDSNCRQHPLMLAYCLQMLNAEPLSDVERTRLKTILAELGVI